MPYDEDKQVALKDGWIDIKGDMKECIQCKKSFKMGEHPDKPGKKTELNEDGSRHKKFKFPPKEENGKKVWEWTCTTSKADWSQKKFEGKPAYNQNFPISSKDLIAMIKANCSKDKDIINSWVDEGREHGWYSLARFAGVLIDCEIVGNTAGAFVGMCFNDGGKK